MENPENALTKVWRPQGFEGLELAAYDQGPSYLAPVLLPTFSMQVAYRGHGRVHYHRRQRPLKVEQPVLVTQTPGEVFGYELLDDTPLVVRNLDFYPALFTRLTRDFGETKPFYFPHLVPESAPHSYLTRLLSETFVSFERPALQLERESRLTHLVREVLKYCADTPPVERSYGRERSAVKRTKDYLLERLDENVSFSDLSSLTELSGYHLLKVFKAEVGIPPHVFQLQARVQRAKDLLQSGWSIAYVASSLGFADQAHFTRIFKRYTLVTPGQFVKVSAGHPKNVQDFSPQ